MNRSSPMLTSAGHIAVCIWLYPVLYKLSIRRKHKAKQNFALFIMHCFYASVNPPLTSRLMVGLRDLREKTEKP